MANEWWKDPHGFDEFQKKTRYRSGRAAKLKTETEPQPQPQPNPQPNPQPDNGNNDDKGDDKGTKLKNIGKALGGLADIAGKLKDPGLNYSPSSTPVRPGGGESRSITAESGPDYWRSHKNDLAAGGGKISSPNDNEEDDK